MSVFGPLLPPERVLEDEFDRILLDRPASDFQDGVNEGHLALTRSSQREAAALAYARKITDEYNKLELRLDAEKAEAVNDVRLFYIADPLSAVRKFVAQQMMDFILNSESWFYYTKPDAQLIVGRVHFTSEFKLVAEGPEHRKNFVIEILSSPKTPEADGANKNDLEFKVSEIGQVPKSIHFIFMHKNLRGDARRVRAERVCAAMFACSQMQNAFSMQNMMNINGGLQLSKVDVTVTSVNRRVSFRGQSFPYTPAAAELLKTVKGYLHDCGVLMKSFEEFNSEMEEQRVFSFLLENQENCDMINSKRADIGNDLADFMLSELHKLAEAQQTVINNKMRD
jgi:hypothetical protein